ncbi:hypothetical protein FQR65_LT08461 [Abscondita terminalis]|nr:hypothetical protein FQR65_LT08461 [Abscondita terminalis]
MPPQTGSYPYDLNRNESEDANKNLSQQEFKTIIGTYKTKLKWVNIISITLIHVLTVWTLIMYPYFQHKRLFVYSIFIGQLTGFGVTGGAHRFWTHKSFKAKLPLRIFLMFCYTLAAQNTLFDWVRDHRVHHRYTETDADPHNSKRGFFFSHVGWLMMRKTPEVIKRGQEIDMDDITSDPVVKFHLKYFVPLKILIAFVIPTSIPPLLWGESWFWSFMAVSIARYVICLNITWSVNSFAHIFGHKPYDKSIKPTENIFVSFAALGEGWHNFHHTFPWDYKCSELYFINATALWIDLFAKIGWAYDLKRASNKLVQTVALKRGDGTRDEDHVEYNEEGEEVY